MNGPDEVFADPFLKRAEKGTKLPPDARLACAYEVFVSFENFDEAAFFRRTEWADELWIGEGDASCDRSRTGGVASVDDFEEGKLLLLGRAYAAPREGEEATACRGLLERLFRARVGFYRPERLVVPGIIDQPAFDRLVGRLKEEVQERERAARKGETEIVAVARELGLCPHPTGIGPDSWYATCLGHSHVLFINAAAGSFACPWSRRKGGVEELRAFVKERWDRAGTTARPARRLRWSRRRLGPERGTR